MYGESGVLLAKVFDLALRVDHRRLILLVRRRQDPDVVRHVLEVALADPERDVAVLDLLVRRVQAGEALVAVDRLVVVAARELRVRDRQLRQHRELRERVLLLHELEILLCLGIVVVLELGQTLLVILLGRERVGDRLCLFIGARASDPQCRRARKRGDEHDRCRKGTRHEETMVRKRGAGVHRCRISSHASAVTSDPEPRGGVASRRVACVCGSVRDRATRLRPRAAPRARPSSWSSPVRVTPTSRARAASKGRPANAGTGSEATPPKRRRPTISTSASRSGWPGSGGGATLDSPTLGHFAALGDEACFYIDVLPGTTSDVTFTAREGRRDGGVAPVLDIAEYGPKGPWWYDIFVGALRGTRRQVQPRRRRRVERRGEGAKARARRPVRLRGHLPHGLGHLRGRGQSRARASSATSP